MHVFCSHTSLKSFADALRRLRFLPCLVTKPPAQNRELILVFLLT